MKSFTKLFNFKSINTYLPKLYTKLNKFVVFNNYSILYFIDGKHHLPFATNIHQILFGVLYTKKNNFNFYFNGTSQVNKFSKINNKFHNVFKFFKKKYRFYYFDRPETNFFKRSNFLDNKENDFPISNKDKNFYYENIHEIARNELFFNLKFYKDIELDNNTLVIHLRGGDVFYDDWHSLYVQNPLSFYLKISKKFENIIIVTEHIKDNFILKELDKRLDLKIASGSLEEDANILLNARNLATSGVSAFPIACALLSQKLENLLVTNIYLEEHLNPKMINKNYVNIENYKVSNYIEIGDFKKSDHNLKRLLSEDTSEILKLP